MEQTVAVHLKELSFDREKECAELAAGVSQNSAIGFAGFNSREALATALAWSIYAKDPLAVNVLPSKETVYQIAKDTLLLCQQALPGNIHLFIFPCKSEFVAKHMNGVSGMCPWKNTILLFLTAVEGWQEACKETIAHEYCHAIMQETQERNTIADHLVFEGFAEHFRESVVGGNPAKWSVALSEKEALAYAHSISHELFTENDELFSSLFFGSKQFPQWTGYTIGYLLVKAFLKKTKQKEWKNMIKNNAKTIIDQSKLLS
ncbi:MAG: hypothetical protein H6502_04600 [Candidatus Woesearchaeota archaeon]|nr:MAG: hypothetical protein H6502_04600 [Candidatus Woesearchaeota archaeon]